MASFLMHSSHRGPMALGMACTLGTLGHVAPGRTSDAGRADACALLTDAEAHTVAPGTGQGHPGKAKMKNVATCEWDNAHGMPALMLQVMPVEPAGIMGGLQENLGSSGYDILAIPQLGDEAATAIQQADPKYGMKREVAILSVRVGDRELNLSPTGVTIDDPGTPSFAKLAHAAALAVERLQASG